MQEVGVIFQLLILIFSVILHEISHGYMAYALGDMTAKYEGRLTLNPIPHIDPVGSVLLPLLTFRFGGVVFGWAKPVPFNPYNLRHGKWGEALVALAGPLSNISIALVFSLIIRGLYSGVLTPFITISSLIVLVNLALAFFNLIPIPPLDGSRILFAVLPLRFEGFRIFLERNALFIFIFFLIFVWDRLAPAIFFFFRLFTGLSF